MLSVTSAAFPAAVIQSSGNQAETRPHLARADKVAEWPMHHVGKFSSEKDAVAWIEAHAWLTKPVTIDTSNPPRLVARQQFGR
jgi:hypothetical protein